MSWLPFSGIYLFLTLHIQQMKFSVYSNIKGVYTFPNFKSFRNLTFSYKAKGKEFVSIHVVVPLAWKVWACQILKYKLHF